MKKAIVGLAAIAVIIGLLRVVKRKAHKMREHCEPMDTEVGGRSEALSTA